MQLSVVIPFYNEENNVVNVIKKNSNMLDENNIDYEIVAVQNGSKDKTSELIDSLSKKNKRIKKVNIKVNKGLGYGVRTGMGAAKGKYICFICGDDQVDVKYLLKVFKLAEKKGTWGLYKIKRIKRYDGLQRKIISVIYNVLTKVMYNVDTYDMNATPKIFGKEVFEKMKIESNDWFIDSEIMIKAKALDVPTYEIPAIFEERKEGKSNVKFSTSIEFLKNAFKFKKKVSKMKKRKS